MRRCKYAVLWLSVIILGGTIENLLGQQVKQDREQAIRKAVYEFALARSTGDLDTFMTYASQRAIKFESLLFEVLIDIPGVKDHNSKAGITDGTGFMRDSFAAMAKSTVTRSRNRTELEEKAKQCSQGAITFKSATEASIVIKDIVRTMDTKGGVTVSSRDSPWPWRIILEGNQWKIDDTNARKESYYLMPLRPESLAKLKAF